jgi:hypothetical protein
MIDRVKIDPNWLVCTEAKVNNCGANSQKPSANLVVVKMPLIAIVCLENKKLVKFVAPQSYIHEK